jgi:hypothetical protein
VTGSWTLMQINVFALLPALMWINAAAPRKNMMCP